MRRDQIAAAVDAYLECALWTDTHPDSGCPYDYHYTVADFSAEARADAEWEITDFYTSNSADLEDLTPEQVGHDLWLTRNHHGVGFWDRDLEEIGDRLTAAAHLRSMTHCYISDSGSLEIGC